MPIDYRYHIGSFVAIFLALLLGILIGIGLAPNPEELKQIVNGLKKDYETTRKANKAELEELRAANQRHEMLAKETIAGIITRRLSGLRIAIILDHNFKGDPLPDKMRATLNQAGAILTSTTTIMKDFVALPPDLREKLTDELPANLPPGVHFRSLIAESLARNIARGRPEFVLKLQTYGLIKSSADSSYNSPVNAVLLVGGPPSLMEASPERIDLVMIEQFKRSGVRVVGCEAEEAPISCVALYKAKGIPTVDNADTLAGRLAIVVALTGVEGHYGVKDTADRFLPDISSLGLR